MGVIWTGATKGSAIETRVKNAFFAQPILLPVAKDHRHVPLAVRDHITTNNSARSDHQESSRRAFLRCWTTLARSAACSSGLHLRNPSPDLKPSLPSVTSFSR